MGKIVSMEEAVALIKDGDELVFNGFGSMGFPEEIAKAVGERFLKEGHPRNMKMICGAGQGVWNEADMIEKMSHDGMFSRVITAHFVPMRNIVRQVMENKVEGYNFPLGVISHLLRASGGRKPGIITRVGLKTFIDPRQGGGAMNEISKERLSRVMEIDGEEFLFYKAFKPNIALLKGTTIDVNGNITMEKEAVYVDPYASAMCVKANGGKVIVQVERRSAEASDKTKIKLPAALVDAVVIVPEQRQSMLEIYNAAMAGEWIVPEEQVADELARIADINQKVAPARGKQRGIEHKIIARRAAMEIDDEDIINLGIGVPELVPAAVKELGKNITYTLTVESGLIGGHPVGGLCFGAGINTEVLQDESYQFDFYNGGGLDATFVGAMQVDCMGNVNVSKSGNSVIGVGGFIDLTTSAKKVIYCFPFSGGGLKVVCKNGKIEVALEGKYKKFCSEVEQISASGELAAISGQTVLFVTERCVFRQTKEGIELIEIAPGIELERDILSKMEFYPLVSDQLKVMDEEIFRNLDV